MATVIQPLVVGARVAFTITIPIPASVNGYGSGIVTDTLPTGFGLYTGEDAQNSVTVGDTTLVENTDYTKAVNGQTVTYTINNDKLTASQNLVVTIDTTVTDKNTVSSPSTNTADLTFENVSGILGTGSVEYSLINPGPISYTGKTLISGMEGAVVPLTLSFETDGTTDPFNYVIENNYGSDLTFVSASYKVGEGEPVDVTPAIDGTKYSYTIPSTAAMANSSVELAISTIMNAAGSVKTSVTNVSSLTIGGTTSSTDTETLTVVPAITVTKALKQS